MLYPVKEQTETQSIESLEKAGFKKIDGSVIMDNGHVLFMLIKNEWWPLRYD